MRLLACGQTDTGISRTNNEDNFCVEEGLGLLAVADGIGGSSAGEIASKMAVDVIRDYITRSASANEPFIGEYDKKNSEFANRLASAIRLSNKAIYEASQNNAAWRGMGTTVAAALFAEDRLSIAHVGDSRGYLIRANSIVQLTDDHSVVSEQVRQGLLTREEASESNIRNIITRALGKDLSLDVDIDEVELMDDDRVLLCTDGLTTMVSDDAILSMISSIEEPEKACCRLIDTANKNGGKDNVTVVVAHFSKRKWFSSVKNLFKFAGR